ncbi:MAG: hypothetical protein R2799_13525 [Crocinitomicaceae bacterium]
MKHLLILLFLVISLISCSSEDQDKSYAYKITFAAERTGMEQLKAKGILKEEMENALDVFRKRFHVLGVNDLRPTLDFENCEILFEYNASKEIPKELHSKLLGNGQQIGFYECYEASEILSLIFGDAMKKYVVTRWIDDQDLIDVLIDSNQIATQYMEKYFPAQMAIDVHNTETYKQPFFLLAIASDTAKINEILKNEPFKNALINLQDVRFVWDLYPVNDNSKTDYFRFYALKSNFGDPYITGESIANTNVEMNQNSGQAQVKLTMNENGADQISKLTAQNLNKYIAIVLEDKLLSAPIVVQQIVGGEVMISGNFSPDQANELIGQLNFGQLPMIFSVKN